MVIAGGSSTPVPRQRFFIMTNTNPIDHAIVALLLTFEGICWIINELAGFHAPLTAETAEPEIDDPRDTIAIEAPVPEVFEIDLTGFTVKQLRTQAKGLAKGIHLMRKQELIALLA